MTKDTLFDHIWPDTFVTDDSLVQCISEIRKALGPNGKKLIQTVPKKGYRLLPDVVSGPKQSRSGKPGSPLIMVAAVILILLAVILLFRDRLQSPPALADPLTVAVLPFLDESANVDYTYFADGISEDLTIDLSNLADIRMLSRGSVRSYSSSERDPFEIARKLDVDYLVDGSVRRVAGNIRISVQLVDGRNGTNVWAGRFEGVNDEVFDLQKSVLTDLTRIIAVRLSPIERERIGIRETTNALAYDEFLRGRYRESEFTREGNAAAIDHYTRATVIDPMYGRAFSRLANVHLNNLRVGWDADRESTMAMAIALAEKGTELSPDSPNAWWTLARIVPRLHTQEGLKRAITANDRTLKLAPDFRDAWVSRAWLMLSSGKPDEAKVAIDKAMEVPDDFPYFYWHAKGAVDYIHGDFDAALTNLERAISQNSNEIFVHWWLVATLVRADRLDDAEWEVEEIRALGFDGKAEDLFSASIIVHKPYRRDLIQALELAGF